MKRPVFSPELFNARVETQIQSFFDAMNNLYGQKGWHPEPPRREDTTWRNTDFIVEIVERYRDGAYKRIRFTMRNLPGYARRPSSPTGTRTIRYEHVFVFDLPREYPQSIGMIRPTAQTPLYHPRISARGTGPACYSVRGELDRILEYLPFFVLLKPDHVEPPSKYKSDHGLNSAAMAWYEQNMEHIIGTLDRLWEERHNQLTRQRQERISDETQRGRVQILDSTSSSRDSQRQPRILDSESEERSQRVRILEDEDTDDE
ncbi:MAG: hypothetical protein ACFFDP_05865 [Promethearchaeota archaeon]